MSDEFAAFEERKKSANELMAQGLFEDASEVYFEIVNEIDNIERRNHDDPVTLVQLSCLNNLAMAYLKLKRHQECIDICSKALQMDRANLKAYYRRSLSYMELARLEDTDKEYPKNQREEWIASEYWDKADADADSILKAESENKQGKNLKADIRKSRLDMETKSKYSMKTSGIISDTKNSVYKGFPGEVPHPKEVPAVSEQDITNHIRIQQKAEQERLAATNLEEFQNQRAESYAKTAGYVFLDPNWTPESAASSAIPNIDPSNSKLPSSQSSSSSLTTTSKTGKKSSSFKDILRKAKHGNGAGRKVERRSNSAAQDGESKKLVETEAVKGALDDLRSAEDLAKERVINTYTLKDVIGNTRAKGSEQVKERLGFKDIVTDKSRRKTKGKATGSSELKEVGECGGVWAELEMEEKEAISAVKQLVHDRNLV